MQDEEGGKMKILNLKFCYLIYKEKEERELKKIIEHIKKANKINKKFWKIKISKFNIKLIYTRGQMNQEWGRKTENWFIAFANDNQVRIFSPKVIEKVSSHNKGEFLNTIVHEISHIFYKKLASTYKPLWLNEGIAMNLGIGKRKKFNFNKIKKMKPSYFYSYSIKKARLVYPFSFFAVKLLFKKGKEKIIKLIRLYSKNPNEVYFKKQFLKIYGFKVNELIQKVGK